MQLYLPSDHERALRSLSHGRDLAVARRGDRATHADVIWCLIEEAVDTLDGVPDQEKSWQSIGSVSAGFGGIGLSRAELKELELLRYLSAMKPYDGPVGQVMERDQVARAMDAMSWLRWIGVHVATKEPERMRRAAIALARGGDSEVFHRTWRPGRKFRHQAATEFRVVLGGHILAGLEIDLGIHAVAGLGFTHRPVLEAAVA